MMFECIDKIYPSVSIDTVTGSICSFNDEYGGLPLKSHKIALTATQSGSGTPSPSNPRPISGYSAINISHSDADTSNPTVYTIQIGSTVYGGEYDARTGVLTVTHGIVDLGTRSWSKFTDVSGGFYTPGMPIMRTGYSNSTPAPMICENLKTVAFYNSGGYFSGQDKAIAYGYNYGDRLYARNTDYTESSDFAKSMSGIKLVYKLATPTTIQLPPCPIDTLEGVNNIFADCGDTTLEYIKIV